LAKYLILFFLSAGLYATERDFLFKTTTVESGDLGRIIAWKAKGSVWSTKETGATTHRGEVFSVAVIDVSAEDFAEITTTTGVYWYVDNTHTASTLSKNPIEE